MADIDYNKLRTAAELINIDEAVPTGTEVIPSGDNDYWIRYANVPRDDTIYVHMDRGHFDQAQMFEI